MWNFGNNIDYNTLEQSVIGAFLSAPKGAAAVVGTSLSAGSMMTPMTQAAYQAVLSLGKNLNEVSLIAALGDGPNTRAFVSQCASLAPKTAEALIHNVRMLADRASSVEFFSKAQGIINAAGGDRQKAQSELMNLIMASAQAGGNDACTSVAGDQLLQDVANGMDRIAAEKIPSPWMGSPAKYSPRSVIAIRGRPGVGKTSAAEQMALNWAKMDVPVLFFSIEMTVEDLGVRLAANLAGRPISDFDDAAPGAFEDNKKAILSAAHQNNEMRNIRFTFTPSLNVNQVRTSLRYHRSRGLFPKVIILVTCKICIVQMEN